MATDRFESAPAGRADVPGAGLAVSEAVIAQIVARAGSAGFERWWSQLEGSGFCTAPVHLVGGGDERRFEVMGRCNNRRAAVCPSCSQLRAGDTWQLVHAGIGGGLTSHRRSASTPWCSSP